MKQLTQRAKIQKKLTASRHYILMGDVIQSRQYEAASLRKHFLKLINACNEKLADRILSPYTVTLGDEFQGIAGSLEAAVEAVFYLEETSLLHALNFSLRYVLVWGKIDTPINPEKAHAMMGEGLTRAREILTNKKRTAQRFRFDLQTEKQTNLFNNLFLVTKGITDGWNPEDAPLIFEMISNTNNADVGSKFKKDRTQIWKRRKSLMIEEYRALKESIFELAA